MQVMFHIIIICFGIKVQAAPHPFYYILIMHQKQQPKTIIKHNNINIKPIFFRKLITEICFYSTIIMMLFKQQHNKKTKLKLV